MYSRTALPFLDQREVLGDQDTVRLMKDFRSHRAEQRPGSGFGADSGKQLAMAVADGVSGHRSLYI
jgi:hypothetical protein